MCKLRGRGRPPIGDEASSSSTQTITPYVTASYGIMAPEATPLIGGWSLFKLSGDDGYGASGLRL